MTIDELLNLKINFYEIQQLIAEIAKINEQIIECYQSFDGQLLSLHQRKVKTQQAIYQVSFQTKQNISLKQHLLKKICVIIIGRIKDSSLIQPDGS